MVDDRIQAHARAAHANSAELGGRQWDFNGCFHFRHDSAIMSYESIARNLNLARGALLVTQDLIDQAIELMKTQQFGEALPLLQRAIDSDPSQWGPWYMAGQCCRFLHATNSAVEYLSRAAAMKSDDPSIFLALGIAFPVAHAMGRSNRCIPTGN